MYRSSFLLPLFLLLFACQSEIKYEQPVSEFTDTARYFPSGIQKMRWLAGAWKGVEAGRTIRQSFQFHGGNALEILSSDNRGETNACSLVWREGRYYYGQQRQWIITWIGEKDVRLDPVHPGPAPMTWTRLNDYKWHIVRHLPVGDVITVMERANEMHP